MMGNGSLMLLSYSITLLLRSMTLAAYSSMFYGRFATGLLYMVLNDESA